MILIINKHFDTTGQIPNIIGISHWIEISELNHCMYALVVIVIANVFVRKILCWARVCGQQMSRINISMKF